jgi:hypothetical protein
VYDLLNSILQRALVAYPEYKKLFVDLCALASKHLNGNPALPGAAFHVDADYRMARFEALDRTYNLSLGFVIHKHECWGMITVSLAESEFESINMFQLWFDYLGNVRDSPTTVSWRHGLTQAEFVLDLADRIVTWYFSHQLRGVEQPSED